MKKLVRVLDLVMGVSVGLFLGRLLYLLWHTGAYPQLYAMQSAPWYAGLLVPGLGMALCLAVGGIGKFLIRRRAGKGP